MMPNDSQMSVLEKLANVLKPFSWKKRSDCFSNKPVLKHITEVCTHKYKDYQLTIAKDMKSRCLDYSSHDSAFISLLLDKCSLLDPRFKAEYLLDNRLVLSKLETEML